MFEIQYSITDCNREVHTTDFIELCACNSLFFCSLINNHTASIIYIFHHLLSFSSLFSRLKRAASYDTASVFSTDDDTVPYIYGTQFDEREDFLVSNEVEQEEEEEEEEEDEEDEPEEDDDEGLRFETENIIPHCAQITHVFPCVIHNLVYWVTKHQRKRSA